MPLGDPLITSWESSKSSRVRRWSRVTLSFGNGQTDAAFFGPAKRDSSAPPGLNSSYQSSTWTKLGYRKTMVNDCSLMVQANEGPKVEVVLLVEGAAWRSA